MKIFKSVMRVVIVTALIAVAYLSGIYSAKYRQNQEENKSTIMTIAVVNADAGVIADDGKKYYSAELMSFPDTNFISAGLTDAQEGVASGRYAAYILIPENFSASVESINSEPVKTQLTYALNDNLRQDVEIKVVNDIHNFMLNLSTNISYIYVDAILKELHAVQDDSLTIMQNDKDDMESVEGVMTAELIDTVEYSPLETVETEIVYMDLSEDYGKLEQAVSDIATTYSSNIETAETEFDLIKEGQTELSNQKTELESVFAEVDILTDTEGNSVYAGGIESLEGLANEYKEEPGIRRKTAKERLGFKEGDKEPEPEAELPEGEERIYISKDDLLEQIDMIIGYLEGTGQEQTAVLAATVDIDDNDTVSNDTTDSDTDENETYDDADDSTTDENETISNETDNANTANSNMENRSIENRGVPSGIDKAVAELKVLKQQIEEYYDNAIRAINEIPDVSELSADVEQIIMEEISAPIKAEAGLEAENVSAALATMQETLDDYVTAIDGYDAMSYMENDKIAEYKSAMNTTVSDMEYEIMNQDDLYLKYIDDVLQTADSNIEQLQGNLDSSYEQTTENIRLTMDAFKENRENINELNVALLGGITQKLPYTRLGTLEYTQAYDFIVQPILYSDNSGHTVNITSSSVSMDRVDLIKMCIGITALIAIYIAVQIIHRRFLHDKENREEDEQWQVE